MNNIYIDKYPFQFRYVQICDELSSTTRRYIETLFSLTINYDQIRPNNKITNEKIKYELSKLKKAIEGFSDTDDYNFLNQKYYELENMVVNNENYIDLLIKLDCAAGIYPNTIFLNRAKKIFYTDVYLPIMNRTYKIKIDNDNKSYVKTIKPIKAGA